MEGSTAWISRRQGICQSTLFSAETRYTLGNSATNNGLSDLCNTGPARQERTYERCLPKGRKNGTEGFDSLCYRPEKNFLSYPNGDDICLAHEDAYLDPHVRQWAPSQSSGRIGSSTFSDYLLFMSSLLPIISFGLSSWLQILPLGVMVLLMLSGVVRNRLLLLSSLLRATTVVSDLMAVSIETRLRDLLNICSSICALVLALSVLWKIAGDLIRTQRESMNPFTEANDPPTLSKPLLSSRFPSFKNPLDWVGRKMSAQLDSTLRFLSPEELSSGFPVGFPTIGFQPCVPRPVRFAKFRPDRSGKLERSEIHSRYENFVPASIREHSIPDQSLSTSSWCRDENIPNHYEYENADRNERTRPRTDLTVRQTDRGRPQLAVWTVAVLLLAILFRLCWSDLTYLGRRAYLSFCHIMD